MKGRLKQIKQKYAPALDIDDYVSKEEAKLSKRQEEAELDLGQFRNKSQSEIFNLEKNSTNCMSFALMQSLN